MNNISACPKFETEGSTLKKLAVFLLTTGFITLLIISVGFCETTTDTVSQDPSEIQYAIQIGAYLKENVAEQKIIDLKNKGYDPYIFQSLNDKNQTVYAVRIGKYDNYQAAVTAASQIQSDLNLSATITSYDSLETAAPSEKTGSELSIAAANAAPSSQEEKSPAVSANGNQSQNIEKNEEESEGPPTLESLQKKIQSLEYKMKLIRDESEVRKELQVTEEESKAQEKDILEAAGQEYTLTTAGNIQFTYSFSYAYSAYDAVRAATKVEDVAQHSISNGLGISYGVMDNLALGASVPFVYNYQNVGTVDSRSVDDLGDLGLSWQYQPIKSGKDLPTIIVNGGFTIPEGRSPYDIDPNTELSTSSGMFSTSLGVSVSQVSDPVVVFGSYSFNYPLTVTNIHQKRTEGTLMEVDPGKSMGIGMGMAYALSYKLSMNASFGYTYAFMTKYKYENAASAESGVGIGATINLGIGYKISRKQNLNFKIGIPVTSSRTFDFSFSTPIEFKL